MKKYGHTRFRVKCDVCRDVVKETDEGEAIRNGSYFHCKLCKHDKCKKCCKYDNLCTNKHPMETLNECPYPGGPGLTLMQLNVMGVKVL